MYIITIMCVSCFVKNYWLVTCLCRDSYLNKISTTRIYPINMLRIINHIYWIRLDLNHTIHGIV